jgi:hypothetical protein
MDIFPTQNTRYLTKKTQVYENLNTPKPLKINQLRKPVTHAKS